MSRQEQDFRKKYNPPHLNLMHIRYSFNYSTVYPGYQSERNTLWALCLSGETNTIHTYPTHTPVRHMRCNHENMVVFSFNIW